MHGAFLVRFFRKAVFTMDEIKELIEGKIKSLMNKINSLTDDDFAKEEQYYQLLAKYIALAEKFGI